MKKIFSAAAITGLLFASLVSNAQKTEKAEDKSKRPSPPAMVKETLASGAVVSIDYSQPSVKGRTIGKDLEPMNGQVWRTGANEATVFETSKDVKINGETLPAGKYALFTIRGENNEWTIIFNKTWKQWGAYDYKKEANALTVKATGSKAAVFTEKLTFTINKNGTISLLWGDIQLDFKAA